VVCIGSVVGIIGSVVGSVVVDIVGIGSVVDIVGIVDIVSGWVGLFHRFVRLCDSAFVRLFVCCVYGWHEIQE
jgi:hypothetical protein